LVAGRGGEHVVSWLKRLLVRCGLGLVLTFILWRGLAAWRWKIQMASYGLFRLILFAWLHPLHAFAHMNILSRLTRLPPNKAKNDVCIICWLHLLMGKHASGVSTCFVIAVTITWMQKHLHS
jgi:hypothetical protein